MFETKEKINKASNHILFSYKNDLSEYDFSSYINEISDQSDFKSLINYSIKEKYDSISLKILTLMSFLKSSYGYAKWTNPDELFFWIRCNSKIMPLFEKLKGFEKIDLKLDYMHYCGVIKTFSDYNFHLFRSENEFIKDDFTIQIGYSWVFINLKNLI